MLDTDVFRQKLRSSETPTHKFRTRERPWILRDGGGGHGCAFGIWLRQSRIGYTAPQVTSIWRVDLGQERHSYPTSWIENNRTGGSTEQRCPILVCTRECGGLSLIFTHPPEDKKKEKKKGVLLVPYTAVVRLPLNCYVSMNTRRFNGSNILTPCPRFNIERGIFSKSIINHNLRPGHLWSFSEFLCKDKRELLQNLPTSKMGEKLYILTLTSKYFVYNMDRQYRIKCSTTVVSIAASKLNIYILFQARGVCWNILDANGCSDPSRTSHVEDLEYIY